METDISTVEKDVAELAARAEAFLFREGESLPVRKLKQILGCSDADLESALKELEHRQEGGGIALVRTESEVGLVVSKLCAPAIQKENEKELEREVGDAGLEVLAILLYRGAKTRSQIDYIRGVNTSSTLRTLLARGLAQRTGNPNDAREYIYSATTELLAHLGVTDIKDLPEYAGVTAELAAFEQSEKPSE
ncbi:MAG: SMC-Scp complex subunit ScpB [bacterium]|nr:SMC-Scp complex subunit ScpB [bacterium]